MKNKGSGEDRLPQFNLVDSYKRNLKEGVKSVSKFMYTTKNVYTYYKFV
jgi:hypothetical protein